ncbi:acyltransferase family protein [Methylocapsa aurea]|uniref:acyltransferase family protein n=1 Tax=Methylocapsa aurea TaxID=663610 RepID=UPI003D1885FD
MSTVGFRYRRDIDGLRAVAIVPVVLFHAGVETFSGGYIGVDVFFVISGYLITKMISDELNAGAFSILRFYERRMRRILPALTVVVAISLALGWIFLLPLSYRSLANSAIATAAFASNIYFWRQTGYFEQATELFPLLHTWSLAVEEQFYIGFPLLVLLLRPMGRTTLAVVTAGAACVSFALSAWAVDTHPSAAFFFLPTRAWELALGALLALGAAPIGTSRYLREFVAAVGLLSIVIPVIAYSRTTRFPGLAALPPCLGAAAVIWAGQSASDQCTISKLLGLRWMAFIGLISYSLYLWHWPILVFARHMTASIHLDPMTATAAIALATFLAIVSWRYVETPFRNRALWRPSIIFTAGGLAASSIVAAALAIVLLNGAPWRFEEKVLRLAAGGDDFSPKGKACMNLPYSDGDIDSECRLGVADGRPMEFLLWGDSHAAAIVPAMDIVAERAGVSGGFAVYQVCPALTDVVHRVLTAGDRRACWQRNKSVLEFAMHSSSLRFVILVGYWTEYLRHPTFVPIVADDRTTKRGEEGPELLVRGLEETIARLSAAGKRVVIFDKLPEPGFVVPWTLAMSTHLSKPYPTPPSAPVRNELGDRMRSIFDRYRVIEIAMDDAICTHGVCKIVDGTSPIFKDQNHLSAFGATNYYAPFLYEKLFGSHGAMGSAGRILSGAR